MIKRFLVSFLEARLVDVEALRGEMKRMGDRITELELALVDLECRSAMQRKSSARAAQVLS